MKKFLAIIMMAALVLSFAACTKDEPKEEATQSIETEAPAEETEEPTDETDAPEDEVDGTEEPVETPEVEDEVA